MSLIVANSNDLIVGKPLPWPLYDLTQNLLLAQGDIVRDDKQRDVLLACRASHELSWEAPRNEKGTDSFSIAEEASQKQSESNQTDKSYTFDDMKLKVGDKLQLELPARRDRERFLVKVIGFLKKTSLMITIPHQLPIYEGNKALIRSFSGESAFAFSCTIERIIKTASLSLRTPYEYIHLSFPDKIEGVVIRKAHRVKTSIITTVQSSKLNAEEAVSALISDISANGASLDAKKRLGDKGDIINLSFRVSLHNVEAYMSIKGVIRTILGSDTDETSTPGTIRHGVEFQELKQSDCVILKSMIYQQMIENPHKLI